MRIMVMESNHNEFVEGLKKIDKIEVNVEKTVSEINRSITDMESKHNEFVEGLNSNINKIDNIEVNVQKTVSEITVLRSIDVEIKADVGHLESSITDIASNTRGIDDYVTNFTSGGERAFNDLQSM